MYNQPHIIKVEKPKGKIKRFFIESLRFLGIFAFFMLITGTVIMWPNIQTAVNYYISKGNISETGQNLGLPVESETWEEVEEKLEEVEIARNIPQDSRVLIPKINVNAPLVFMQSTKKYRYIRRQLKMV